MKRMFDKEEIVEIAKEEGGSITVDSELSPTSENPVQNKVIYEALADKQDVLPDTTGQTDKFLKVGSEGLEWAEAGGGGKYLHHISLLGHSNDSNFNSLISLDIINDSAEKFTSNTLRTYLRTNGYNSSSNQYEYRSEIIEVSSNGTWLGKVQVKGFFGGSDSKLYAVIYGSKFTYAVTDGALTVSLASYAANQQIQVLLDNDIVIPL